MASSITDTTTFLPLQSLCPQPRFCIGRCSAFQQIQFFRLDSRPPALRSGCVRWKRGLGARACVGSDGVRTGGADWKGKGKVVSEMAVGRLQDAVAAIPPMTLIIKGTHGSTFMIGFFSLALTILVVVLRQITVRKAKQIQQGSVADLVKRGQLRSDRRGISKPLKYEDPFNNPLVKSKDKSTIEICGKVYRLAPVTLTEEKQSSHQKRRSRAYNWKRPTIFLREGDDIPPDVDPDRVRWIPANHPFATTVSDIDENMAQNNVNQKDGVPFRIRVEHEALQRKLEALQREKKLNNVAITPNSFREFEAPSNSVEQKEQDMNTSVDQQHNRRILTSEGQDASGSNDRSLSEDREPH